MDSKPIVIAIIVAALIVAGTFFVINAAKPHMDENAQSICVLSGGDYVLRDGGESYYCSYI